MAETRSVAGTGGGSGLRSGELPAVVRDWPPEWQEELAEREAILEYDARMAPERAARAAENIVRERFAKR